MVVEEYLDGPEVSLFAITDGSTAVPLVPAQDFKRVGEGDAGPNTGGMGAYAPLPWAPAGLVEEIMERVVGPTIDLMAHRGTPFSGLLYAGLALTSRGLRVVEFNARFGDPETQVVLALLRTPLAGLLNAAAHGTLDEVGELQWHPGAAVTVVLAAPGYPEAPTNGRRPHRRARRRGRRVGVGCRLGRALGDGTPGHRSRGHGGPRPVRHRPRGRPRRGAGAFLRAPRRDRPRGQPLPPRHRTRRRSGPDPHTLTSATLTSAMGAAHRNTPDFDLSQLPARSWRVVRVRNRPQRPANRASSDRFRTRSPTTPPPVMGEGSKSTANPAAYPSSLWNAAATMAQ